MTEQQTLSMPKVHDVRMRINNIQKDKPRYCLMSAYLFASRISELVACKSPSDVKTTPRGPAGKDVQLSHARIQTSIVDAAVFRIKTAKRGGLERLCALPLDRHFEPWTEELVKYYRQFGDSPVFACTRQSIGCAAREAFRGLRYPIFRYAIGRKDSMLHKVVDQHTRPFNVHALRHLRATELIEVYGFDGLDLSVYGGWTLHSMIGVGTSMERYAHIQWQKYFPKLLMETC